MIHVQTKLFSEQSLSKTVMSWLIMAIACRAVSLSSVKSAAVALTSALMQSRQYLLLQLITQLWLHPSLKCGGQNMNRYNCCCSLRIPYTCSVSALALWRRELSTDTRLIVLCRIVWFDPGAFTTTMTGFRLCPTLETAFSNSDSTFQCGRHLVLLFDGISSLKFLAPPTQAPKIATLWFCKGSAKIRNFPRL